MKRICLSNGQGEWKQTCLNYLFLLVLVIGVSILSLCAAIIVDTDSPGKYVQDGLNEQIGCAREAGFKFIRPLLRVRKEVYFLDRSYYGLAYVLLNIIVVVPYASDQTLAHELGHIIDWQTKRKGHPAFDKIKDLDNENFADAIAEVILDQCRK